MKLDEFVADEELSKNMDWEIESILKHDLESAFLMERVGKNLGLPGEVKACAEVVLWMFKAAQLQRRVEELEDAALDARIERSCQE